MHFGLLGPLEVVGEDGVVVPLPGERERTLLATLLLSPNRVVTTSRLVDAVWGEDPPATAKNTLQVHVAKLRRKLAAAGANGLLSSAPGGYMICVEPGQVDVACFEKLVGDPSGGTAAVSARLGKALAFWRGPALADVHSELLDGERARLDELHLVVIERRVDADLALGRHLEVLPELEALVHAYPLREALRGHLITALYRAGRQADALASYQEGRRALLDELGVDPGPALRALELAILRQDPHLAGPGQSPSPAAVPQDNLPVHVTKFIGRERELADLRDLVQANRLLTLTGAGGSGKTRLALQLVSELRGKWANGTCFVDLAPLSDPDLVTQSVATAMGVREGPGSSITERLLDALRDQEWLVLLDNCEHLVYACAKLVEALVRSCAEVQVLATSREPLGVWGERIYRVPTLSVPARSASPPDRTTALHFEAVQLFLDRAKSHNAGFVFDDESAPTVVSVCGALDGIPLAIELAAARLRSLSINDIARHLGARFHLLTGGSRTALPRHQTLRALIDWSYEMLDYRDRAVLARLSVFAGGFDLEVAETVCASANVAPLDVLDAIGSLVDKSLVQAEPVGHAVRYRLLETVRQYAEEKLREDPGAEAATREAHARTFLDLAEAAAPVLFGKQQGKWLERLVTEYDNLRSAAAHFLTAPVSADDALRLGVALREYWSRRDHVREGLDILREALDRSGGGEPTALRASACAAVAQLCSIRGEPATAHSYIENGLEIASRVGANETRADLLVLSAWLGFHQGDLRLASQLIDRAIDLARQCGNDKLLALARHRRAAIRASVDRDQATVDMSDALGFFRVAGDLDGVLDCLNGLSILELMNGDVEAGRALLEEARLVATDSSISRLVTTTNNLCLAAIMEGDVGAAVAFAAQSLEHGQRYGAIRYVPYNLLSVGLCLSAIGDLQHAAMVHGAADALLEGNNQVFEPLELGLRRDDHSRLCEALGKMAFDCAYEAGRRLSSREALGLAHEGLELARTMGNATSDEATSDEPANPSVRWPDEPGRRVAYSTTGAPLPTCRSTSGACSSELRLKSAKVGSLARPSVQPG